MRARRGFVNLAALFPLGVAISCTPSPGPSRTSTSPSSGPAEGTQPAIQVTRVVSQQLNRTLQLPGDIWAYQDVAIYPKVQGFVQKITVDRGSQVRNGQLLIQMTAPELMAQSAESDAKSSAAKSQTAETISKLMSIRSQRLEAEARMAADDATYTRLKAASATPGVVAGNELEIAQHALESSRARVAAFRENEKAAEAQVEAVKSHEKAALDAARSSRDIEAYLHISAPFEGIVTERNVHEGSFAGPSAGTSQPPMLRVQEVSRLRLVVYVPEAEVGGIIPGNKVAFAVPAFPGEIFSGIIRRIAHALDARTRTMPVELEVANPSGRLAPGMYAEVRWPSSRSQPSLFVPPLAVATNTERTFVIRIRDGLSEWVDVRRGVTTGNLVEVFGDLAAGDRVASRGTDELRPGTRVTVMGQ